MKKVNFVIFSAMICGSAVWSACGGPAASGPTGNDDSPFGSIPGIYAEVAAKGKALDEELRTERDMDRYGKKLKEHDEWVDESYRKAAEEGTKITGRPVACSGDVNPDFKVTSAKVEKFDQGKKSGSVIVRVMVTPKHDLVVRDVQSDCSEGECSLRDARLYYVLLKADDSLIAMGELNPFNANYANGSLKAEYVPGQMVRAGVPCHSQGAPVSINCHTYDFTDFAKIAFLPEKDYQALRRQAYGF